MLDTEMSAKCAAIMQSAFERESGLTHVQGLLTPRRIVEVLQAVGGRFAHSFDLQHELKGGKAIDACGITLPDASLELCQSSDAILAGASGGPKWDVVDASVRPEAGILQLRSGFGLFVNIRPAKARIPTRGQSSEIRIPRIGRSDHRSRIDRRRLFFTRKRGSGPQRANDEAVDRVLSSGYCTADLARSGGSVVTTKKMGTLIAEEL